jgi:hypothetical protein
VPDRPGGYLSSSATNVGIPGFWLGYWTKFGEETASEPGFITTDGRGLACSSVGCTTAIQGECNTTLDNAVRNVAVAAAVRPGDPTGLVHLVQVTPLVGVDEETTQAYAGLVATAALSSLRPRVKP